MSSIRLSDKHGVNPAVPRCFWCGKDRGEVVLFGRLPNDAEAPRNPILDYEPCDTCKGRMGLGITIVECMEKQPSNGNPPMQPGAWPTGRWAVITPRAVARIFNPPALVEQVLQKKIAFMDKQTYELLGLHVPPSGAEVLN